MNTPRPRGRLQLDSPRWPGPDHPSSLDFGAMPALFEIEGRFAPARGATRAAGPRPPRGLGGAGPRFYISPRKAEVGDEAAAELSKRGPCVSLPADLATEAENDRLAA